MISSKQSPMNSLTSLESVIFKLHKLHSNESKKNLAKLDTFDNSMATVGLTSRSTFWSQGCRCILSVFCSGSPQSIQHNPEALDTWCECFRGCSCGKWSALWRSSCIPSWCEFWGCTYPGHPRWLGMGCSHRLDGKPNQCSTSGIYIALTEVSAKKQFFLAKLLKQSEKDA